MAVAAEHASRRHHHHRRRSGRRRPPSTGGERRPGRVARVTATAGVAVAGAVGLVAWVSGPAGEPVAGPNAASGVSASTLRSAPAALPTTARSSAAARSSAPSAAAPSAAASAAAPSAAASAAAPSVTGPHASSTSSSATPSSPSIRSGRPRRPGRRAGLPRAAPGCFRGCHRGMSAGSGRAEWPRRPQDRRYRGRDRRAAVVAHPADRDTRSSGPGQRPAVGHGVRAVVPVRPGPGRHRVPDHHRRGRCRGPVAAFGAAGDDRRGAGGVVGLPAGCTRSRCARRSPGCRWGNRGW